MRRAIGTFVAAAALVACTPTDDGDGPDAAPIHDAAPQYLDSHPAHSGNYPPLVDAGHTDTGTIAVPDDGSIPEPDAHLPGCEPGTYRCAGSYGGTIVGCGSQRQEILGQKCLLSQHCICADMHSCSCS